MTWSCLQRCRIPNDEYHLSLFSGLPGPCPQTQMTIFSAASGQPDEPYFHRIALFRATGFFHLEGGACGGRCRLAVELAMVGE